MSRRLFEQLYNVGSAHPKILASRENMARYIVAMKQACPHWTERDQRMAFAEMKFSSRWIAGGQIVYDLSHSMAAMFSITSAPPIDWKHTPHEAFVIKVPRRFLPVDGTIEPEYSYIYASQEATLLVADYDTTAVMLVQYGDTTSRDSLEITDPAVIRNGAQEYAAVLAEKSVEEMPRYIAEVKRLMPGITDAEALLMAQGAMSAQREELRQMAEESSALSTKSIGRKVLVNRFVSNVMAYVTEHRPALGAPSKAPGSPLYAALVSPAEVVIDRAFRDAAGAAVVSILEGSTVGIRRALAHHVRGHWREQACGAGHSLRKRIWIMPHRRGDESLGSVVRRIEHINLPTSLN